ncbi:MAG: PrsW family intramembrane metalloprotease [Deltaproteobacteria bacterium]|nr:PrsW family intramembrane metalloprotease [Deltaproteobacteria bacterium]
MVFAITAVSAIVPSLLLVWYFRSRDLRPEPAGLCFATFGLGLAIIVPVLLIDGLFYLLLGVFGQLGPYGHGLSQAFLMAAVPEELCKFGVVWLFASRRAAFDEPMDGAVYGVLASLGFATLENVLYTLSGGLGVAVFRALTAVPAHAFFGAVMGSYIGRARLGPPAGRRRALVQALLWPMLLHGLYDFPILTIKQMKESGLDVPGLEVAALCLAALGALIAAWIWAVRLVRRLRREQRAEIDAAGEAGEAPRAEAPAPARPAAHRPSAGRRALGWTLALLGGLLASGGGLASLGIGLGLLVSEEAQAEISSTLLGGAIIGLLPLVLGLLLFRAGLRRIRGVPGDSGESGHRGLPG